MSIRTKLLILLLVIAAVPMLVAVAVGQASTRFVGNRLTTETRAELIRQAENRLQNFVDGASALAGAEGQAVSLIVAAQARAFARIFEDSTGNDALPSDLYFAVEDFDGNRRPSPGSARRERYGRDKGSRVTFDAQSIVTPPDVDPTRHPHDLVAHSNMLKIYRQLRNSYDPGLILFQYTCTAAGVHGAYPGHGGYPGDYEPRQRSWYQLAIDPDSRSNPDGVVWGPPMIDAGTGQAVLTVSAPVRLSDGRTVGVTAVDIRIVDLLEVPARSASWTSNEEIIIGSLIGSDPSVGVTSLEIYAQRSYGEGAVDWRRPIDIELFRLDAEDASRALVLALQEGRSGVVRTSRDGQEILCAFAPIYFGKEETTAGLFYTVPFDDVVMLAHSIDDQFWTIIVAQLSTNLSIAALILACVVFVAFRGSRSVTRPVQELAGAVQRVAHGDLSARAEVHTGDELQRLAENFNEMIPALRDRVQLRQSLDLAMEVQQALLPREAPNFPGFDIDGRSIYCDETGGDYYDFLVIRPFDEDHLGVVLGDVTGHGIAAALLMTTARAILRSRLSLPGSLAEHVNQMNAQLAADNQHGRFMTMCFLIVESAEGRLRWVLAGHDAPIVYDPASDACEELESEDGGIPLGIDGSWEYREIEGTMSGPGQVLVVGTDGIWEARNERDEMFGKDRLRDLIRRNAERSAREIMGAIVEAIEEFRGETPQLDDITLVVVKRTAP